MLSIIRKPKSRRGRVGLAAGLAAAAFMVLAGNTSCSGQSDTATSEQQVNSQAYAKSAKQVPAHTMDYPVTRATINFWIDTWGKNPNKLSYVYLLGANGQQIGYYVFKGLPVSMCTSLTPNYDLVGDSSSPVPVPEPGIDGVFYSGGECNTYYGKDATTGAFIEYTAGNGISPLIYDQPIPHSDAKPLGFTVLK